LDKLIISLELSLKFYHKMKDYI